MTAPQTAAGKALLETFVDNQHHDNVDAAYECSDDIDRCDFCAQEADDILAIEREAAAAVIERVKQVISTRAAVGSLGIGSGAYAAVLAILDAEAKR